MDIHVVMKEQWHAILFVKLYARCEAMLAVIILEQIANAMFIPFYNTCVGIFILAPVEDAIIEQNVYKNSMYVITTLETIILSRALLLGTKQIILCVMQAMLMIIENPLVEKCKNGLGHSYDSVHETERKGIS